MIIFVYAAFADPPDISILTVLKIVYDKCFLLRIGSTFYNREYSIRFLFPTILFNDLFFV